MTIGLISMVPNRRLQCEQFRFNSSDNFRCVKNTRSLLEQTLRWLLTVLYGLLFVNPTEYRYCTQEPVQVCRKEELKQEILAYEQWIAC
jgi:hypothetical protein